jgi:protein-L-isoaspartate(D-aspartate) O-methyltransferase
MPKDLLAQLKGGGLMVIPVGGEEGQSMHRITRTAEGSRSDEHGAFSFVPMLVDKVR